MKLNNKLLLLLILILAGFFRLYRLSSVPPSPSLDEVSVGYNAYSILKTGADEYSSRWPILLRAYDDWRPAGYVYLVIPFVRALGLSVVSVRLPAALLGILAVLVTYLLVTELFRRAGRKGKLNQGGAAALAAAFLLAVNPWHVYLSRLGHEVNAGLTLSLAGVYFLIRYQRRRNFKDLVFSSILCSLSLYTYQSIKIFAPVFLVFFTVIFRKFLLNRKNEVMAAGLIGLVLAIPILRVSLTPEASIRFQGTSLFANQQRAIEVSAARNNRNYQKGYRLGVVLDNRRMAMARVLLRNYLSHFDPTWLFFNLDEEDHKAPDTGLLYLWELPLLVLGTYWLVTRKKFGREKKLLLGWLLISPLAAGITTQAPHAMRTANVLPLPQILAALGLLSLQTSLKKNLKPEKLKAGLVTLGIVVVFSLVNFAHHYFINFPFEVSEDFQTPLANLFSYLEKNEAKFERVVITNQDHGHQSYMFYLFFSRYDPVRYQEQGGSVSGGYQEEHRIGKYDFRAIDWAREEKTPGVLWILNYSQFTSDDPILETFSSLDGRPALKALLSPEVVSDEAN